jgi:predicted secreted protein
MKLIKKIGSLNSGDILTLGIILGAFGADVFLNSNKVRVGFGSDINEQFGNCPPGQVYNRNTYSCVGTPTVTVPVYSSTAVTTATPAVVTTVATPVATPTVATTVATPTPTPAPTPMGLTFSGNITTSNSEVLLTGNNDTIYAGGTSAGSGVPDYSGSITYSNGSFSGSWLRNGTPIVTGSGNSISGTGMASTVVSNATYVSTYSGSITYSNGAFSGTIYVAVNSGQSVPYLMGQGQSIIGFPAGNNEISGGVGVSLLGAINAIPSSTDVAGILQSVMTNLSPASTTATTATPTQASTSSATCQANITTATNVISQSQSLVNTISSSNATSLYNQMKSYLTSMQNGTCNPSSSAQYLAAIQNGYTQLQAGYNTIQTNMQNAKGIYASNTLTAVNNQGCCNWWTQGASQGNWNVSSISGGNATLNLNQLNGSVTVPLSTLQTLVTAGQANIQLTTSNTTGSLPNELTTYQNGANPPSQETVTFYLQST